MTNAKVWVVKTGNANIASMQAGLRRAGAEPVLTESADEIRNAGRVVLPGVGTLGQTKQRLDERGLSEVLQARVRAGRPLFAVCVGLHLLFEESEESPGVPGLASVPGLIRKYPSDVRVPQFGWNRIEVNGEATYLESGEYYFANSYRLTTPPSGYVTATGDHGGPFVAAFERGGLLACQFHPELSGEVGGRVMQRWVEQSEARSC